MTIISRTTLLLIGGVILTFLARAQSDVMTTPDAGSHYYIRQSNGLEGLLTPDPKAVNIHISYYVKIGPVYEGDSVSGISDIVQGIMADKIKLHLQNAHNKINNQNATFSSTTTTEQTVFELTSGTANYAACLKLLCDSLNFSNIHEGELQARISQVRKEIEANKNNYLVVFNSKLIHAMYRRDASRQLIMDDTSKLANMDISRVRQFYKRYYVPENIIINITGNFDPLTMQDTLSAIFKEVHRGKFDPQQVTKVVDFKPMVYNIRFTVNSPVLKPELYLYWQFPGTRSNPLSSYYAFLLTTMLNDPNNYIQILLHKMGCQKFVANYIADNFSGMLKIEADPANDNFYQTYNFLLTELQRLDQSFLNQTNMDFAKVAFSERYDQIKKSNEYPTLVTKYWIFNNETYFPSLRDSVYNCTVDKMRKFIIEYINQSPHVIGLMINQRDRDALKIDSAFVDFNDSIDDFTFTYRRNITDLEGTENLYKLNRLVQWLQGNPDLVIQVNGFADTKEFNHFRDDSIRAFIDSVPTFERVRRQIIPTKSFRPEMLRALKIVKYLYEQGIDATRLKGTSMPFTSKTREDELNNMKCTISIDKVKKAPSVYEYHYGMPKPVDRHQLNGN